MLDMSYYILVLATYIPGLWVLYRYPTLWQFPILVFTFLGMFLFGAVGSINVFLLDPTYWVNFDKRAVFAEYTALLVVQVLIFYVCAFAYLYKKNPIKQVFKVSLFDELFIFNGLALILFLSFSYYLETGTFLFFQSVTGHLNIDNAYDVRMKYIYGLKNWPIYNIGFSVLPVFISSFVLIRSKVQKKLDKLFFVSMIICFAASLSMGSKAGLLAYVLTLGLAIVVVNGKNGISVFKVIENKKFFLFTCLVLLTVVLGYYHATPSAMSFAVFLKRFWYRLAVASTESIAAAVSYANNVGFLGASIFPNARGMLPHTFANLPLLLHQYTSLVPGGVNTPFIAEIFLVKGWPSVFLICPIVYGILILLQEVLLRINIGVLGLAFSAYYSYMAVLLSTIGMASTFLTFMYPLAFGIVLTMTYFSYLIVKYFKVQNEEL